MTAGEGLAALTAAADAIVERAWATDRPRLVGVGWATVELDRAEAEVSLALGLPREDWRDAPRDALLGAGARIARPTGGGLAVVLLEPDTEGRLAATLARSGEGVAVAYVELGAMRDERVVLSRPADTPLGTGRLVVGGRAWGPHVVAVDAADPPRSAHGPRDARRYHRAVIESEPIVVRAATSADAERIAALLTEEGYPVGPSDVATRLGRFDGPAAEVVVAEIDGSAIGFIALHAIPRFEHDDVAVRILALVVDPTARERGVGRLLMVEAERFASERGAAFVEVTAGHHRPDARRLYESLGYDPSATAYLRKRL